MYATISNLLNKFIKPSTIFKKGFNLSPMYRRSTGRVIETSDDLLNVKVKIPISYKNKNYVGSIFGGSLFSATDPILMIQLIQILGDKYVVWDKSANIKFKRPAKEDSYIDFDLTLNEITSIKNRIKEEKEIDLEKEILITNKEKTTVFAEVSKTIYIADKSYYKTKRKKK